jgi:hypothetical protein
MSAAGGSAVDAFEARTREFVEDESFVDRYAAARPAMPPASQDVPTARDLLFQSHFSVTLPVIAIMCRACQPLRLSRARRTSPQIGWNS